MIAVLQRVNHATVRVAGQAVGEIGTGLLILLGVGKGDVREDADRLAAKIAACRIFCDEAGKMNRSLADIGGGALVVSNFTLLADYSHGNRPSYFDAAQPLEADDLYRYFCDVLRPRVATLATGEFGADMKISMEADGPVTITMDSKILKEGRR
ncbi:MAG: D-tyrosyl-tRNA(Tyr) deacylase [Clostridia bacterium]|nr:D-tyrosyl-tRNA(Tyr) deacylase [Clostridia bacterium]